MSWLKVGLIVGGIAALPLLWQSQSLEKRGRFIALLPDALQPNNAVNVVNSKVTVFQSQGKKGEASFSDRHDGGKKTHTRVIDNTKGTTFHSEVPKEEVKASSVLNVSQDHSKFQQQAQKIQHARMERVINDE